MMSKITQGYKVVTRDLTSAWTAGVGVVVCYQRGRWVWPELKGSKLFAFDNKDTAYIFACQVRGIFFTCDLLDQCIAPEKIVYANKFGAHTHAFMSYWAGLSMWTDTDAMVHTVMARAIRLTGEIS